MSVTKLKTVGRWRTPWREGGSTAEDTNVRGRVITGMLTGGDPSDTPAVVPDQGESQTR